MGAIARLSKRQVEAMVAAYDGDPVGALSRALRLVLDAPGVAWDELLDRAAFDPARATRLRAGDVAALDALLAELNEMRTIGS